MQVRTPLEESSKCILSYCNSLLNYTCFKNLFIIYSSIFKIKTHLILHKWIDTRPVAVIRIWFISIALLQELKMKCQIWDEMALAVHNICIFSICYLQHQTCGGAITLNYWLFWCNWLTHYLGNHNRKRTHFDWWRSKRSTNQIFWYQKLQNS